MKNVIPIPLALTIELHDDPTPPPGLTPLSYAERLYLALAPLALRDSEVGWSLLILCNAIGGMFQETEDIARDSPEGPGWSALMDLPRCPPQALPWLAQFVGVRLLPNSTSDAQRARIAATDGFSRGTPKAIRGAAQATLTGTKTVYFNERYGGDAYTLQVVTLTAETPDPAATQRAILSQKPAGLVLTYAAVTTNSYAQVEAQYATYTAVKAAFATYAAMRGTAL